jgi:tRNA A-37 threonylcarbamoyl transferase component Bud32
MLTGGVSNRTVLVERGNGEVWVLKQALARLRVQADWFSDPARIHREATGLRWLERLAPRGAVTPLVFEDRERHLLAMRAVPQPHENWKSQLLAGRVDPDCVDEFARLLGTIHRGAQEQGDHLRAEFADRSFFESLRLEPYYGYAAQRVSQAAGFLRELIEATRSRAVTIVHGDYSPKNILVRDGGLVLLDHEVIHWGDPAFDVGFAMTHLLSKANHVRGCRDAFTAAGERFWNVYRATIGDAPWADDLEPRAVRHTLGCVLARVDGRSPLEYLSPAERDTQRTVALRMMESTPRTMPGLARRFGMELNRTESA